MMSEALFYIFAGLAVISAGVILFSNNILYAAFALVITFLSVAAIYVLAQAEFVAITQIMVYVGGIVVLLIFGVMLTNKVYGKALITGSGNKFLGAIVSVALSALLLYGLYYINFDHLSQLKTDQDFNNVERLGIGFMSDYILPFEMAAILLLVALVGAASIAGSKKKTDDR